MKRYEAFAAVWMCPHGHRFAYADHLSPTWCPGCGTSSVNRDHTATASDEGAVKALEQIRDRLRPVVAGNAEVSVNAIFELAEDALDEIGGQ